MALDPGEIHYGIRGQRFGPVDLHTLVSRLRAGQISADDFLWDDELDDTVMHVAGEAHYAILAPLGGHGSHDKVEMIASPVGGMIPKPALPKDNIANIERAKAAVLADLARHGRASLRELTARRDTTPAAMSSALLLLKQDGRIRVEGDAVLPC